MQDEFRKLDAIDQKVMFWMMDNRPKVILGWLHDIAPLYKRKGTPIDVEKLYGEVEAELNIEIQAVDKISE